MYQVASFMLSDQLDMILTEFNKFVSVSQDMRGLCNLACRNVHTCKQAALVPYLSFVLSAGANCVCAGATFAPFALFAWQC